MSVETKLRTYVIKAIWDDEARVWYATSDDVAGLALESGSLDVLIERCRHAVIELLEANGNLGKCRICFNCERYEEIGAC